MSKITDTFFGGAEKDAGEAQADASREAARLTQKQFEDVRVRLDPFINESKGALYEQAALSGARGFEAQKAAFRRFVEDPGTKFLREQGLRMIDTGAGATGQLGSGDRLRELTKFSQGLALQDLQNRFNRMGAISGAGLQAASALGGVSSAASATQAQALMNAGSAEAAGITGQAAGLRSGLQSTFGLLASDARLKCNIERIGVLDSGLPWYRWDWRPWAIEMVGEQPPEGVMAHEAASIFPDAVVEIDGFLRVDYRGIH